MSSIVRSEQLELYRALPSPIPAATPSKVHHSRKSFLNNLLWIAPSILASIIMMANKYPLLYCNNRSN